MIVVGLRRMRLCSACLLGLRCRYNGKVIPNPKVIKLSEKETLIPVCPEQLGGLTTPRPNVEIKGGDGNDVLDGKAGVFESNGTELTKEFVKGAEEVLKVAKICKVNEAILKQRSPSCGCGQIYDGTFSKKMIVGYGVTSALLKRNGIKVITEEDV